MPATRSPIAPVLKGLAGVTALGVGGLAYAGLYEMNAFRLRRFDVPVLPTGAAPIRVLHISDLHMTPGAKARQRWVAGLAGLEPDLVVNTGDNISHVEAGAYVLRSLGRLLDVPGVFVWGSNDYFVPTLKNPIRYLTERGKTARPGKRTLPWRDLGRAFADAGWVELTNTSAKLDIHGIRIGLRGTDDAHLHQDEYGQVAGPIDRSSVDLALGVTHAPYRRVIDAMAYDGHDLILAGHTHGGQVCVPLVGALVTNCDLDPARAKGLSQHSAGGRTSWMHVSAGLGTSPYAPVRFACKPEATLLTLTAKAAGVTAAMG
ncbi:MAG TPA: metallophosphoesterase [Propionibacteriaceae bacterium]|nr:metallophosphoesterase [Propionibacteriaceae bacterium]